VAPPFNPEMLAASLAELIPGYPDARLCVALSGGVDSMALLHAAQALTAAEPRLALRALHVDHGLQPESAQWAEVCRRQCEALGVPLRVLELRLQIPKGASIEAEARRARYRAMEAVLEPGESLLTAHHADDQLETVLLQLFRGAGVAGLAAMPRAAALGEGPHLRPLLGVERAQLEDYASRVGLGWVEDPMNRQSRYDRSYLRHEVLPTIRARWPSVARTVGRSAGHFAAAQGLLEGLAQADGATLVDDQGRLEIAGLMALPRERQLNVLRWWIVEQGLGVPSAARLESILLDAVPARQDAQPVVTWPTGEIRRYRGRLYAMAPLPEPPSGEWMIEPGQALIIEGVGQLELVAARGAGFSAARCSGPFAVRFRQGGERLRPVGQVLEKPLQQIFQEAGIVPWRRGRLPMLFSGERLVAVGEQWIAAEAAAGPGETGYAIRWVDGHATS
jgi:tRNA(Ile)-lysidine synthase